MHVLLTPWTYLKGNNIDMGYSASFGSDIFFLLQYAGTTIAFILMLFSLVLYLTASKAQEAAAYKKSFLKRIGMMFLIASAVKILSIIMIIVQSIFG